VKVTVLPVTVARMERARGTVAALWRWPVESMAGERVNGLRVDGRGAGGDRCHAVTLDGRPLTAGEAPRLLAWAAAYPFNLDAGLDPANPPFAVVTAPDGHAYRWGDPRLRAALEADLGRPVELLRDVESGRSLLVTTDASLRALAGELDGPIDLRRFRANVHLDLDAPAWAEERWEGAELAFAGGVRLRVLHPCERGAIATRHPDTQAEWPGLLQHLTAAHGGRFGVHARVVTGGRIGVGESLDLTPF
jgi:MOSC domain-containing protein